MRVVCSNIASWVLETVVGIERKWFVPIGPTGDIRRVCVKLCIHLNLPGSTLTYQKSPEVVTGHKKWFAEILIAPRGSSAIVYLRGLYLNVTFVE